jgi:hypothetical protein
MDDLFLSGCQLSLTADSLLVYAPDELIAIALRRSTKELANWAVQFKRKCTVIFFPGCGDRPYRIPAALAQSDGNENSGAIYTPGISDMVFSRNLKLDVNELRVLERMRESQKPMSICDLESDDQEWVNFPLTQMLQLTANEATELNMKDYWEEDALAYVKRILQQQSVFEHNYEAMLPYTRAHFDSTFEVIEFGHPKRLKRLVTIHNYEPVQQTTTV